MKTYLGKTFLQQANAALQARDYLVAITLYESVKLDNPALFDIAEQNITFCKTEFEKTQLLNPKTLTPESKLGATVKDIKSATTLTKKELATAPKLKPEISLYQTISSAPDSQRIKSNLKIAYIINATIFDQHVITNALLQANNIKENKNIYLIITPENRALAANLVANSQETIILETGITGLPLLSLANSITKIQNKDFDVAYLAQLVNYNTSHEMSQETLSKFTILQTQQLAGAATTVDTILDAFETQPTIGFVGCADAYKSSKSNEASHSLSSAILIQQLNASIDPAQSFGYFSGANFWARAELLNHIEKFSSLNYINDANNSDIESSLELLLSFIPTHFGFEKALSYPTTIDNVNSVLVRTTNTAIPHGSHYSIGVSFKSYEMLSTDQVRLEKSSHFSTKFYCQHYPYLSNLKMVPHYHFLRFGAQEGFNPNLNFSAHWYWELHKAIISEEYHNPLIHHLVNPDSDRIIFPAQENLSDIMNLVDGLSVFDENFYLENNPDVAKSKMTPLFHYCKYGWKELRLPCKGPVFDAIWYDSEYLTNWNTSINPLLHYAVCSSKLSLDKYPTLKKLDTGYQHNRKSKIKRICLFAGYDAHGIIDEYVVKLISELSIHSDVYYLADSEIPKSELEKIKHITVNAWAFRHGEYDFGSYARLAFNLVGWNQIQQYDELLLINDSGYLLKDLKPLFKKMDSKVCDWWGLQATKGIAATRSSSSNQYTSKIPMTKVLEKMIPTYEHDDCYDFLIGSYFLAFRKPTLISGGVLHTLLKSVRRERNKRNVVLRYEIGLTRKMLLAGHKPATFIDHLYPFHPIFTDIHFELISKGFPLFKRYLLTNNHYKVPNLSDWKNRIIDILPFADLDSAERNLWRICSAEKLYATLNIPSDHSVWPRPLLNNIDFKNEDLSFQKDDQCWAFPVCAFDHLLGGNERMVFEAVKNDPSIKKVILTRSKKIDVDGVNLHVVPLKSREGQDLLIESRYIFIKHTPWRNAIYPLDPTQHRFINLWHGIPLKRIGYTSLDMMDNLEASGKEHDKIHAVIASSKIDRLAMAAAFYPLTFHDIWMTGLPRNDVILRDEGLLPLDFQDQLQRLRSSLGGRKLVLFAPTFRNGQGSSSYQFTSADIALISECMLKHNAVLGVREHMATKGESYHKMFTNSSIPMLNLGVAHYADIELIYREASILITDYSSCFIDFMLTGKPEICFAYDYDSYAGSERGLFYELKDVFPGPVCDNAKSLVSHIDDCLNGISIEPLHLYEIKRRTFFEYIDDNNTSRVIQRIQHEITEQLPARSSRRAIALDYQGA